jgi:hypothetical protein
MAKLLYEVHLTDIARDSSGLCTAQRYDEIDAGGTLEQSVQAPPPPRFSCTVFMYEYTIPTCYACYWTTVRNWSNYDNSQYSLCAVCADACGTCYDSHLGH